MEKVKVLIIEPENFVAHNLLAQNLLNKIFDIQTLYILPDSFSEFNVIILNNLNPNSPIFEQKNVIDFVEKGGGLLCLHDTVSPIYNLRELSAFVGIQDAYATYIDNRQHIAISDLNIPTQTATLKIVHGNNIHPVVENVTDFDIGDEFWAINTVAEVKVLINAEIGDRIPVRPEVQNKYSQPIPVCGCRINKKGRTCFLLPLHYPQAYQNSNILKIINNAVLWLCKKTSENDIFLSYSFLNEKEAMFIHDKAESMGLDVFMAKKDIKSGIVWSEEIRYKLRICKEVAILISPDSIKSEWVSIETGSAWVMNKKITAITLNCDKNDLPSILKERQSRSINEIDMYLGEVKKQQS